MEVVQKNLSTNYFLTFFANFPKNGQKSTFNLENQNSKGTLFSPTFKNTHYETLKNAKKLIFQHFMAFLKYANFPMLNPLLLLQHKL